jgi:hypothetical protein
MSARRAPPVELGATAEGLARVLTPSWLRRLRFGFLLVFRYGFLRRGRLILGAGEAVHPDFVRGSLLIRSGFIDLSGYELVAANASSDAFLRQFYAKHCGAGT